MLAEPERTRYDLNFRVLGFPVRIHPWFWILMLLFGAQYIDAGQSIAFLTWVVAAFVSILVHELGHALAFRAFGSDSHIVLYSFGGLAVPWSTVRGRGRRIVVALAGPFAGFLLLGIVWGSNYYLHWAVLSPHLMWLFFQLVFINLGWGLLNLLPVWPLDGGQVTQEVCSFFSPRKGQAISLQISIVVAGAFCIYSLACVMGDRGANEFLKELPIWVPRGSLWTAFLFGMLAAQSYQMLQRVKWAESHWDGV